MASRTKQRCRISASGLLLWLLLMLFGMFSLTISKILWVRYSPPTVQHLESALLLKARFINNGKRFRIEEDASPSNTREGSCQREYERVTANFTPGLTLETLDRSKAFLGNRHRLAKLIHKMSQQKKAINAVVCGGSISIGHGVFPKTRIYSEQLEDWLNTYYPIQKQPQQQQQQPYHQTKHKVLNVGAHGADMCAMAKRMNFQTFVGRRPDLFVLEFGVNDYQGQDFLKGVDMKTDVFFDGFRRVAKCSEAVVHRLLTDFPDAAIVFLEFQSSMINRRTAQLLHMGVAQHYEVPLLSYADAMLRPYFELVETLAPYKYSVPNVIDMASIQPYPHGCGACHPEDLTDQFRPAGCLSVCDLMRLSASHTYICKNVPAHQRCYSPIFAHDGVHPTVVGHTIAKDLIVDWIATTATLLCQGRRFPKHVLPAYSGWLVSGPNYHDELRAETDFLLVEDTIQMFADKNPLNPIFLSAGFKWSKDGLLDRWGWVATNDLGREIITFGINLPQYQCYEIYLSVLRSYERVGAFTAHVHDFSTNHTTTTPRFDCLWKPRISVAVDFQLTYRRSDMLQQCTGRCQVNVFTHPLIPGRGGNKIKIMSLSVRKCRPRMSQNVTGQLSAAQ